MTNFMINFIILLVGTLISFLWVKTWYSVFENEIESLIENGGCILFRKRCFIAFSGGPIVWVIFIFYGVYFMIEKVLRGFYNKL